MKRTIKVIVILLISLIIFYLLNKLLMPKYMTDLVEGSMISQYYDEEKNHEVIFIGDCEVYANFSPMVLYQEKGISSYVRGSSQQMIWQSYYILKETLKYEIPKVVVFNVNSMRYDEPVSEAYNRLTLDKMKWSPEKIEMIKTSMREEESMLSYIFPILRYHDRFDKLTQEDFTYLFNEKKNTYQGFLINKEIKPLENVPTVKKLANYRFADIDYEYLQKILDLCNENNIKLLLIKAPSVYPHWYEEYDEQIEEFAQKNNINFINFLDKVEEIGIDYKQDTYDRGLHLNLTGATKLSKYFANYLKENYTLTDYRQNSEVNKIYQEKLEQYNKDIV